MEDSNLDIALAEKYFAKTYRQSVDNNELDFTQFIQHITKLKQITKSIKVEIINYAENGNTIFIKHIVTTVLADNQISKHKVFAEFQIENSKIINCDELTILLDGSEKYRALGSEA